MKRLSALTVVLAVCLGLLLGAQPALAQSGNTWTVYYYNNPNWGGAPVFTTSAAFVNFNWGSDTSPAPGVPAQYWSARFTTSAFFYAGIYNFTVQADDDFALYIDNTLYLDTRGQGQAGRPFAIDVPLNQGNHFIQIDYRQYTGAAYLFVNWTFNKGGVPAPPAPPPPNPPSPPPPPAGQLITQFGNYTPCMQQQIHQKNCFVSNGAWDAPNMGSIAMEPQIAVWGQCKADSTQTMVLFVNKAPQSAKCSKTEAGWFPN